MTTDRRAAGYQPDFDIDLARGAEAEEFVTDIIKSFATQRVEVKRDDRALDTGNLYIEYQCLRGGQWLNSGIAASTSLVWVFVIGTLAIAAPTREVRDVTRIQYKSRPDRRRSIVVIPIGDYIRALHTRPLVRIDGAA